jgi:hypothetical protein
MLLFAVGVELPLALAQPACPEIITTCGCRILSPGKYTLGNSVASSSTTEDCVDVNSGGVELDLAGFSVTGPLANPLITSDQVTAVGINFERRASNANFDGGGATVSGFSTGVEITGDKANANDFVTTANVFGLLLLATHDSRVSNFDANSNVENGVAISLGSHNQLSGFATNSNGDFSGVSLAYTAHNRLTGFTSNSNAGDGVTLENVAVHNQLSGFTANSNAFDGVVLMNKADSNQISDFITDSNGSSGLEIMRFVRIGCGGFGPSDIPCNAPSRRNLVENGDAEDNSVFGIDVDNTGDEEIIGNTATSNGTYDLFDSHPRCGTDRWHGNIFDTANVPCIH